MTETVPKQFFRCEPVRTIRPGPGEKDVACFYRRIALAPDKTRRFAERDIREILTLAGAYLTAGVTPPRVWPRYSRFVSGLRHSRVRRKDYDPFRAGVRAVLGDLPDERIETAFRTWRERGVRYRLAVMREFVPFDRAPEFRFTGLDALRRAAGRGGVIVWSYQFSCHTLIGKALAAAGLSGVRVSASVHGFSSTDIGKKTINRIAVAAENRYLADRLVFDREDAQAVTRRIAGKLAAGDILLMANNVFAGSAFVEMPIGESGFVSMPTTPLSFAVRRGTPLFLACVIELEPFTTYAVHFVETSAVPAGEGAKLRDHEAMARIALHARDTLFDHMTAWPDQFILWPGRARSYLDAGRQVPEAV